MADLIQQKQVEENILQECEASVKERAQRYLKVRPHGVIPATHFAAVSAEITHLFRDGHFYGCIALSQSLAEALVRFICECNSFKPGKDYEKNVEKLLKRSFITTELKKAFSEIWRKRNDYHHLNPQIEKDRGKLEKLALKKVRLLKEIEKTIFEFTIINGAIRPKNPKYWKLKGNHTEVFLRLYP